MQRFSGKFGQPSAIALGDQARDAGKWDTAAGHYSDALAQDPDNFPIWVQYGHALKESGHHSQAEAAYRRALDGDPICADTHLQLGHALKIQGRLEESKSAYIRALALDPQLSHARQELLALGWDESQLSALHGALESVASGRRRTRGRTSRITLADRARDLGQWGLAARLYRQALARNPRNPPIWVQYGHALKESGHLERAEDAYRRATAHDPVAIDPLLHLGHVLKLQGRKDEAEAAYLRAFARAPSARQLLTELSALGWTNENLSILEQISGPEMSDPPFVEYAEQYNVILDNQFSVEANNIEKASLPFADDSRPILLMIDSQFPRPDQDQGSVTALYIIKILIECGFRVVFLADAENAFHPAYVPVLTRLGVRCLYRRENADIDATLQECHLTPHLVFLNRIYSGGRYYEIIRDKFRNCQIIFNTVDLHGLRELREAKLYDDLVGIHQATKTIEREYYLIQQADASIVVSSAEKEFISKVNNHSNIHVIPMVVDLNCPVKGFAERQDFCFIGGFAHPPNVDAVESFLQFVWPRVRAAIPEIRFQIVGSNIPDHLKYWADDRVLPTGFVPDLTALLETVRLTVAPLRYGAGVKGKVGASLAHGVPCVATTIAAEGMALEHNHHILIADGPEQFADSIIQLYQEEETWVRLSKHGYEHAKSTISVEAVRAKVRALLETL